MSERQAGWYWVKVQDLPPNEPAKWEAGEWDGSLWHLTCCDTPWHNDDVDEVGDRIPAPGEPWATVPVEMDDAMYQAISAILGGVDYMFEEAWRDVLAAAPKPGGGE